MNTKDNEVQGKEELPDVYINDLLMTIKYFTDEQQVHLHLIDAEACVSCNQPCLYFCPVGVYQRQADGHITISAQSCVECGSCRLMCLHKNVKWEYPRGGFGVSYKFG